MAGPTPPFEYTGDNPNKKQHRGNMADYDETYSQTHRGPKKNRHDIPRIHPDTDWMSGYEYVDDDQ